MTPANPFAHIAASLSGRPAWPFAVATDSEPADPGLSKTERMRAYLRQHGPAVAATLADEADVPTSALVGALLKGDMARGSVYRRGHKYHWNPQFDVQLHEQIKQAAALLRRHGYRVEAPQ
ncbi:MAG: hypothetical protein KGZ67_12530 [Hydrogenophaga sp.]|jgi:predicted ArsR family transcriptional regulator|nr:hypothetical protein [Hydrogenophaga sp.]